jgi:hypothetical protein
VDDGFQNEGNPQRIQVDEQLTDADRGKFGQEIRNSATSRNQISPSKDSLTALAAADTE